MWIETDHINLSASGSKGTVTAWKRDIMITQDLNFLPVVQLEPKEGMCLWLSCPISILPLPALRLLESMSSMGNWCKRISNLEKIKLCLCLRLFWAILVKRCRQVLWERGRKSSHPNHTTSLLTQKETVPHYIRRKTPGPISSMTPVIGNIRIQHQSFRYTLTKEWWEITAPAETITSLFTPPWPSPANFTQLLLAKAAVRSSRNVTHRWLWMLGACLKFRNNPRLEMMVSNGISWPILPVTSA